MSAHANDGDSDKGGLFSGEAGGVLEPLHGLSWRIVVIPICKQVAIKCKMTKTSEGRDVPLLESKINSVARNERSSFRFHVLNRHQGGFWRRR